MAVVAYGLVIAVILFALTKSQLSSASGFTAAFQVVAGILPGPVATGLGWLVALGIVIALASSGGTWVIGADAPTPLLALDRTAPALLGRFSGRYGTPIAVNTMTGITATIMMVIAVLISEFVSGGSIGALFRDCARLYHLDNDTIVPVHLPRLLDPALQVSRRASYI